MDEQANKAEKVQQAFQHKIKTLEKQLALKPTKNGISTRLSMIPQMIGLSDPPSK